MTTEQNSCAKKLQQISKMHLNPKLGNEAQKNEKDTIVCPFCGGVIQCKSKAQKLNNRNAEGYYKITPNRVFL